MVVTVISPVVQPLTLSNFAFRSQRKTNDRIKGEIKGMTSVAISTTRSMLALCRSRCQSPGFSAR